MSRMYGFGIVPETGCASTLLNNKSEDKYPNIGWEGVSAGAFRNKLILFFWILIKFLTSSITNISPLKFLKRFQMRSENMKGVFLFEYVLKSIPLNRTNPD